MHTFFKKLLFLWILFFSTSLFADVTWLKNIDISDASSVHEYNDYLEFAITIESPPYSSFGSLTVHYKTIDNSSTTAGTDYTYTEGDIEFDSDDPTTKTIKVPILNDAIHENTEHVTVEITTANLLYEVIDGSGDGTIYDDDLAPLQLTTFNDKGVTETDTTQTLKIIAYFNQDLPSDVTVTYHTVDNTAHAGSDYVAVVGGTVTATAGSSIVFLPITINGDTSPESIEDFKVIIDSISSGTIVDNQATATIYDDDVVKVNVSCTDAKEGNVGESNNVVCRIFLAKPYPAGEPDLVINYDSQDGSSPSAEEDNDYSSVDGGSVTFLTGDEEKIVNIPTIGDDVVESDENVKLVISGSPYIINSQSQAKIRNDDGDFPGVDFSTSDISVVEGNSSTKTLNYHFSLDADAVEDSYFYYYTQDNTAKVSDNDYVSILSTKYIIPEGSRDINIQVTVNGDTKVENDELFYLKFSNAHHIIIHKDRAKGTIINDDGTLATLQFEKPSYDIVEGNSSTKTLNFTLTLNNPALAGSSFDYYSYDGSAKVDDNDYVKVNDSKYIFSGGETNVTIPVTINGDTNIEDNEEFYLHICNEINLTISGIQDAPGKIINDDGSYSEIKIASNSYSVVEGNSSQKNLEITLSLDAPALADSSIGYYTNDGEAQDGSSSTEDKDYIPTIGTLTIPEGETNASIMIPIVGDTLIEPNENFTFYIDNPHNLTIGRDNTVITILNDDEHNEGNFTCDEHMYLSSSKKRGSHETGKMWLHKIDTTQNPFRFEVMDDEGEDRQYNAIGYNPEDNYIYGLYLRNLIKISKSGKIIDLGTVNALPEAFDDYQLFAGAVYDNEHYYVAGMGINTNTMYIINLNDKNVTEKTLSESINIKDFSLSPDGSLLYGIIDGGQFVKIHTTTGVVTKIGVPHSGEFDSTFSDKNGRFFANDSQGSGFYEFNTNTGVESFLSNSQPATFNDGTNCLNAELLFTDYGDAPLKYQNTWHNIANGIYLGDKVDHDIGSYDTVNADGDDLNGVDDDDGVTLVDGTDINGSYFETGATHQLKVKLSKEAYLKIWIDTKINGTFDNGDDLVYTSGSKLSAGEHIISFTLPKDLPENTKTYLRARVSSQPSMNPTGFVLDGEVEDYMIYFGTKVKGTLGTFNIERVGSDNLPINTAERNAWYTQIAGKDFDYHVVFYDKNMTKELNLTNVPIKVELIDQDKNISIAAPHYDYFSKSSLYKSRVLVTKPSYDKDLKDTFASKNARFRVEYPTYRDGSVKPYICNANVTAKECFDQALASNTNGATYPKYTYARDNFAIRPDMIYVNIADHNQSRLNSKKNSSISLAAGYKYNLTVTATQYLGENPAKGYTKEANSSIDLNSTGLTCHDKSAISEDINFKNGLFEDTAFTHNNVGKYLLKIEDDTSWTEVDQNGSVKGCIEGNGDRIANASGKVGCDIIMYKYNPVELNFQPDHFAVNLNMLNLPSSGHDDFIYMMNLNANNNDVAIAFNGNITAQNVDNNATSNFTAGCVATNLLLDLKATTISDEGPNHDIHTADNMTLVNFSRIIRFNGETNTANFDVNNTIRRINNVLPISSNRFLNDRNGSMSLDMRYNLNKTISQPINPVEVRFHSIDVNSSDANSSAYQIDNHTPSGTKAFPNNRRNFYFARVVSDLNNYPRVNMHVSPLVRTPLNVDIYCATTTIANYCRDRDVLNHTSLSGTTREQNGWYLSTDHNGTTDGNVTALIPNFNTIMLIPNPTPIKVDNDDITLNHGHTGTPNGTFNNCINHTITVTIATDPVLDYIPSNYTLNCTDVNASQWTGIGKSGNILEITPKVDKSGKMDW